MIQRAAHGGIVDGRAVVFQITEYQTENRPEQQQLQMPELRGIQPAQTELTVIDQRQLHNQDPLSRRKTRRTSKIKITFWRL